MLSKYYMMKLLNHGLNTIDTRAVRLKLKDLTHGDTSIWGSGPKRSRWSIIKINQEISRIAHELEQSGELEPLTFVED